MCQSGQVQYRSLPFSLRACWNASRASPFTLLGAIITPCTSILIVCTLSLLPALFPSLTDERALEMKRVTGLKGLLWLSSRFCTACFWQTQDWERARYPSSPPSSLSIPFVTAKQLYLQNSGDHLWFSVNLFSLSSWRLTFWYPALSNPRIV